MAHCFRRLRRLVLGVAVAAFVLSVVAEIRSYWLTDFITFSSPHAGWITGTYNGNLAVNMQPTVTRNDWAVLGHDVSEPVDPDDTSSWESEMANGSRIMWLGIRYHSYFTSMAHNASFVLIPLPLIAIASVLFAVGVFMALRLIPNRANRHRGFEVVTF